MISTVTTATVTIVTNPYLAGYFALIGVVFLFALLLQKELASASKSNLMQRFSKALNVAVFPLLVAFLLIFFLRVAEVIR